MRAGSIHEELAEARLGTGVFETEKDAVFQLGESFGGVRLLGVVENPAGPSGARIGLKIQTEQEVYMKILANLGGGEEAAAAGPCRGGIKEAFKTRLAQLTYLARIGCN